MPTSRFSNCPNELLLQIFSLIIDAPSTLKCRLLNTRCRDIIDSSSALQYAIKLDAWGYENIPTSSPQLTSSDRLNKLAAHVQSWARLDSSEQHHITIPAPGAYDLSQGIFLTANLNPQGTFTRVDLPSHLWGKPNHVQTLPHAFPFAIPDFAFDLSQDLLIVLEL